MQIIADVYHRPPVSRSYPASPPGAHVAFHQGHARICDERTMLWVLQQDFLSVQPISSYMSHLSRWCDQLRERGLTPRAKVIDSDGTLLAPESYGRHGWQPVEVLARIHASQQEAALQDAQLLAAAEAAEPIVQPGDNLWQQLGTGIQAITQE